MAAHDLHQEVKQWSSKDNDIIAAAKKMALLMARLSELVREDKGANKRAIEWLQQEKCDTKRTQKGSRLITRMFTI